MNPELKSRTISRQELIHYPFRHPDKTCYIAAKAIGTLSVSSLIMSGMSQLASKRAEYMANATTNYPLTIDQRNSFYQEAEKLEDNSKRWLRRFQRFAKSSFIAAVAGKTWEDPEKEFIVKTLNNKTS